MNSKCSSAEIARSVRRLRNWKRSFRRRSRASPLDPLGHVDGAADRAGEVSVGIARDLAPAFEPPHRAVRPDRPMLEVIGTQAGDRVVHLGDDLVDLVGMQRGLPGLERGPERAGLHPGQGLERRVPGDHSRRCVPAPRAGAAGSKRVGQPGGLFRPEVRIRNPEGHRCSIARPRRARAGECPLHHATSMRGRLGRRLVASSVRPPSMRLEAECRGDGIVADRLPRRGRGCDGDGLHGRPDRSRRCARDARRPSPRGRWPLAGRVPVRPAAPGLAVLRRRLHRPRPRHRAAERPGGGAPGTGPSVGDPGLLRRHPAPTARRFGPRHLPRGERPPHRRLRRSW